MEHPSAYRLAGHVPRCFWCAPGCTCGSRTGTDHDDDGSDDHDDDFGAIDHDDLRAIHAFLDYDDHHAHVDERRWRGLAVAR